MVAFDRSCPAKNEDKYGTLKKRKSIIDENCSRVRTPVASGGSAIIIIGCYITNKTSVVRIPSGGGRLDGRKRHTSLIPVTLSL
jgi:hypothetical protein